MPFGGVKASGYNYGRFGGKTGVVELQSCDGSALRPPRSTARSDLPSWAVDETCLKVHGRWCYLSRTVDRSGALVDVLFSEHRNMAIAQAFFRSATAVTGITPERVTIDGHVGSTVAKFGDLGVRVHSYPRAIRTTLGKGVRYRTGAYLNNRLERDHQGIKGRYRPMWGSKCPRSAARFCRAYDELRTFLRLRSRHHQHVPADGRRLLHLHRTATVLAILQAA
jgi:putative transposase